MCRVGAEAASGPEVGWGGATGGGAGGVGRLWGWKAGRIGGVGGPNRRRGWAAGPDLAWGATAAGGGKEADGREAGGSLSRRRGMKGSWAVSGRSHFQVLHFTSPGGRDVFFFHLQHLLNRGLCSNVVRNDVQEKDNKQ